MRNAGTLPKYSTRYTHSTTVRTRATRAGMIQAVVMATAWIAPARVGGVRTVVEWGYRVLYFGSVPAFLIRVAMLS